MKILDINNMLDAAEESDMPNVEVHVQAMEEAADFLGKALAAHLKIKYGTATYEQGFGGLCASFSPAKKKQKCPPVIDEGDPGGDWD